MNECLKIIELFCNGTKWTVNMNECLKIIELFLN